MVRSLGPCPAISNRAPPARKTATVHSRLSSAFRNLAAQWDAAGVRSAVGQGRGTQRSGTGQGYRVGGTRKRCLVIAVARACSAIRQISSRRRCGGPLRAAEAACRLRSPGGTWPRRPSAVLRIFSAMILGAFARRTVSTACVTSLCQQRSAGLRTPARTTVNALPLSRAAKPPEGVANQGGSGRAGGRGVSRCSFCDMCSRHEYQNLSGKTESRYAGAKSGPDRDRHPPCRAASPSTD